jgi:hypothetical protein
VGEQAGERGRQDGTVERNESGAIEEAFRHGRPHRSADGGR